MCFDVCIAVTTVEEFNSLRHHENKDSPQVAIVSSFVNGDSLGHVELNNFVFGTNPR